MYPLAGHGLLAPWTGQGWYSCFHREHTLLEHTVLCKNVCILLLRSLQEWEER